MTSLLAARSNSIVDWKEGASASAEVSAVSGFLWLIFRFLVGRAVTDLSDDMKDLSASVSSLNTEVADLKESNNRKEKRLDDLFLLLSQER